MYRTQNQSARDGLDALDLSDGDREVLPTILDRNLAFMDDCLAAGTYSYGQLEEFIRGTTPLSVTGIGIASSTQVSHWMNVVKGWKNRLGSQWDATYAVNNTMYVSRQNILYGILVQFMGTETMGERLLLVETPEFETPREVA